jgi:hypothetical protein
MAHLINITDLPEQVLETYQRSHIRQAFTTQGRKVCIVQLKDGRKETWRATEEPVARVGDTDNDGDVDVSVDVEWVKDTAAE